MIECIMHFIQYIGYGFDFELLQYLLLVYYNTLSLKISLMMKLCYLFALFVVNHASNHL